MTLENDMKAIDAGKQQAMSVLEFRSSALASRRGAIDAASRRQSDTDLLAKPYMLRAERQNGLTMQLGPLASDDFIGRATTGVLIAEGDSWFDYPLHDVLRFLEDDHGYDVESVAHKGDAVEDMAFGSGQLEELTRRIEKVLRNGVIPKAILLSGGGNDVGGDQFAMLLNHKQSQMPHLNEDVVKGVIDCRVRNSYIAILSAVTEVCEKKIGKKIPIFVHGYDYAIPDGRGFLGGFGPLPGPWLEPSFRCKGYDNLVETSAVVQELIDRLNKMLIDVCSIGAFKHVSHIDIRKTLSADLRNEKYKDSWGNELHPSKNGFKVVADIFARELSKI